jgi:D-alanyl-D-alanine carboxypeptidase
VGVHRLGVLVLIAGCGARPDAGLLTPLDATHRLGPDDVPADLVPIPKHLRVRLERVREVARTPLTRMLDAARADLVRLWVSSGFRSYDRQREIFDEHAGEAVAEPPGESEHQLGTAVDLVTGPTTVLAADTEAYAWMDANAWRYGWINSYPPQLDPSDDRTFRLTGIHVEPWHWRYVGEDAAARVRARFEETGIRATASELR